MYVVGDKSKAICCYCEVLLSTTFKERDLRTPGGVVPQVLVAVCDVCDSIIGVPQQSVTKISEAFKP